MTPTAQSHNHPQNHSDPVSLWMDFLNQAPMPTITPQALSTIKPWLTALSDFLDTALSAGTPIRTLLNTRTLAMDALMRGLFSAFGLDDDGIALFAVGGYGRGELLPASDIDLLILHRADLSDAHKASIHALLTEAWDTGLKPAISVRDDTDAAAVADITIATSLLESRFLAGDQALHNMPTDWVRRHWCLADFYHAKMTEATQRHRQQGSTEYNLEPNLKTAAGGLRDLHILQWLARFMWTDILPDDAFHRLVDVGFLTAHEADALGDALHFLWTLRHHLHHHAGKAEDRLLFNYQKSIAKHLGYGNDDDHSNAAPEALMKDYYHHAMTVASLSEMLCALFAERCLPHEYQITPLDDDFIIIENTQQATPQKSLGVLNAQVFYDKPDTLLRLFLHMGQQHIRRIAPETLRALALASRQIDSAYRDNPRHRQLFLDNLSEPNFLYHRLRLMKRYGVLGRYLPDFGQIMGLMQYDLFHRYTVDAHTLFLVRLLHRFEHTDDPDYWLVHQLCSTLPKRHLLTIAALFHDIAKGRGGDHSTLGATLAQEFCQAHGLSDDDSRLVTWLVQEHLTMSLTAQKKDVHDPSVLGEFAKFVQSKERLAYLYVLTVADMNATNAQLWNNWRATLLRQLYLGCERILSLSANDRVPSAFISARKARALARLQNDSVSSLAQADIDALWQRLPDAYFAKETGGTIAWQTHAILSHGAHTPLIIARDHPDANLAATQLLIYVPDQANLFAAIVGVLDDCDYSVLGAHILTCDDGFALDTFVIVDCHGIDGDDAQTLSLTADEARARIDMLIARLSQTLNNARGYQRPTRRHFAQLRNQSRLRHFNVPTTINIHAINPTQHSVFIATKDRCHLLATIGQVFEAEQILVHSAKIATLGERAEDLFVLSERDNSALSQTRLDALSTALIQALDG